MAQPTPTTPRNNPSHAALHNFHVNVKMFGAIGDGTTNDTTAIQTAIDAAGTAGGGVVFFPPGIYKTTSTLNINKNGVLRTLAEAPYRGMTFTTDTRDFTLRGSEVLPGMNAATFDLPVAGLATALQKARRDGRWNALFDYVWAGTFWTKRTRPQLLAFSITGGFVVGLGAFIALWLLFILLRWIGRGFFATTGRAPKVGKSDDLVLSSSKEPSGAEERELSVCNAQQYAAEAGKQ